MFKTISNNNYSNSNINVRNIENNKACEQFIKFIDNQISKMIDRGIYRSKIDNITLSDVQLYSNKCNQRITKLLKTNFGLESTISTHSYLTNRSNTEIELNKNNLNEYVVNIYFYN